MNAVEIYKLCKEAGINLLVEGGNLRVSAHRGEVPDAIKALLREHKQEMLEMLAGNRAPRGPVARAPESGPVLSYAQQRLWFQQQYDEHNAIYNIPLVLESPARLDEGCLLAAFRWLLQRHEPLRTAIRNEDGVATPCLLDPQRFELSTCQASAAFDADVERLTRAQTGKAFDLATDFMIRADVLHRDEGGSLLFVTLHHIAADGWSLDILVDELNAAYDAIVEGGSPQGDALPLRFSDYAAWQESMLQGEQLDAQLSYWKQRLADIPEIHRFPTDKPRPSVPGFRGDRLRFELDESTSRKLQGLARGHGCTLFSLVQAAYAVLVARYSHAQDVVFGTPVANRTWPETSRLIGYFANVLPIRTKVDPHSRFVDLLLQVSAASIEDISRHDVPQEMLIDALKLGRKTSQHPLFQMMLVYEDGGQGREDAQARRTLSRHALERRETGSKFDLTLIARNSASGLAFAWEYAFDLFEPESIQRLAANFTRLLQGIADAPETEVCQLDLIADEEKAFLIDAGTGPRTALGEDAFHHLFERHARENPDALALIHGGASVTYEELDKQANRLAWALIERGVAKGDIVGLCLEQPAAFPVAVLGILKAGAAYLPLDPGYPARRIEHIVNDSGARLWLTDAAGAVLAPYGQQTLDVAAQGHGPGGRNESAPTVRVGADDLAYVIYTSGSTGLPKGTLLEHRGATNLARVQKQLFDINPAGQAPSRVLQFASISFDASMWELLMSLCNGACLVIPQGEEKHDAERMTQLLSRHRVTHATLPPAYLTAFERDDFPSLTHLIVAGEAVRWSEAQKWSRGRNFYNAYGPTETTICSTVGRYRGGRVHMGGPIANHKCAVLDPHGQRVPVGVVGELYLGGLGLARGYRNKPELTQEKFAQTSVEGAPSERWYRSGDLVRWLASGDLEYVGRVDSQVQVRGFRVELGEVESVLASHPDVLGGFVTLRQDPGELAGGQLVAYYSLAAGLSAKASRGDIRQFMEQRLPGYMVPTAYVPLAALPLTINGKIDASALPPPSEADVVRQEFVEPVTDLQRMVCSILKELLPAARIGIKDNFYALGGDSILSIRAVARINALGYSLTSRQFFDAQTVEGIAEVLERSAGERRAYSQDASTGELELTPIQRRFFGLRGGCESRYLQSVLLHVPQGLDEGFFAQFLPALYERHDILRARFRGVDADLPQAFFEPLDSIDPMAAFSTQSLQEMSEQERSQFLERKADECKSAISIERDRLFSVVHFAGSSAAESRLLVIFHHLIVDGVSWRIFLDDLKLAYEQYAGGNRISLPAKATSYQEWSRKLSSWLGSDAAREEVAQWQARAPQDAGVLLGNGVQDVDADGVGDCMADTQLVVAALGPDDTQALLQECHFAYRTQINDILLAALAMALQKWRGITAQDVFLEAHGRQDQLFENTDLSQCLGWFTSLYPVRVAAHGTGGDALRATILNTKDTLRRVPNMGLAYLAAAGQEGRPGIVFNYLGQFDQQLSSGNLFGKAPESTGYDVDRGRRRDYLLGFNGRVSDGRLSFQIDFNRHLFQAEEVAGLAAHYEASLRELLEHCRAQPRTWASPSDFPLCSVTQAELDGWQTEFGEIEDLYPASGNQMGMFFHTQLDAHSSYSTQNLIHLPEGFDTQTFKRAWERVVARHPVLRTIFVGLDREQSLQLVLPTVDLAWIEEDLSSLSAQEQDKFIGEYLRRDNKTPMDYQRAPLSRFALFRRDGGRHVFVWSCSHTILDGWSLGVVYEEVLTLYKGLGEGRAVALSPVSSYRNYIEWVLRQDAEEAREFWAQELSDAQVAERIGIEDTSPQSERGKAILRHALSGQEHGELKQFAARNRMTVNTLVQAAWAYLLSRYQGTDTVITGITLSGRPADLPGVEATVGMMINTVPACVRIALRRPVVEWLQELHGQQLQRELHGYLPLADIVKLKALEEGQSVFNTVLGFHNQPIEHAAASMHEAGIKGGVGHEETHYPLVLGVSPQADLQFTLTYDASRFSRAAMERLCGHLGRVLNALISPETHTVGDIRMLADDELAALTQLAEGPEPTREAVLLPELIRQQAQVHGDATALVLGEESWSFAALSARANQMARALVAAGVRVGDRVGVCQERSLDMLASVVGVMQAGAVYVPLDPGYPDERLSYLLADAGIGHVLTEDYLAAQLPLSGQAVVLVSDADEQDAGEFASPVTAATTAYMIYTSGSTGQPKGVCIGHGAFADKLAALAQHYGLTSEDRGLLFASMSFDASLSQLFVPLSAGGSVALRPDDITEPEALLRYVAAQGVTWMHVVPAYLRQLVEVKGWERTALRRVTSGGDVLDRGLQQAWFTPERSSIALYNSYGPTEISITSSSHLVGADEAVVAIGRPLANTRYWVLDEQGQLLPRGAVGELCIGGSGLAQGYWQRDEQTQQRFVELTLAGRRERLYRTGDRVRWNEEGQLVFVGRNDHQVKVRGYRIELGEVESALQACAGVTGAVVKVEDDSLWAYVALASGDLAQVEAELASRLPAYLLPSGYEKVDEWPLTRSGKIDRKALRRGQDASRTRREPCNEVEQTLHEIWTALLKADDIGVTDNFFQRGGHSLLATRLASQIRRRFEVDFTLKSLFELPSIEEQARLILAQKAEQGSAAAANRLPAIEASGQDGPMPLSHSQNGLWLLDQLEASGASYIAGTSLTVTGPLDRLALEKAFHSIVMRHEILRTVIRDHDGLPMQEVISEPSFRIQVVDATHLNGADAEQEVLRAVREEKSTRFDLSKDVMLRVRLIKHAEDKHTLLMHMHHIVCDGWSIGILMREFNALYKAFAKGAVPDLPALPVQYRDYAQWQRKRLSGENLDQLVDYWKDRLEGIPKLHQLPPDYERPEQPSYRGAVHRQQLGAGVKSGLAGICRQQGTTLFMGMHAAFSAWLSRYTACSDIVLGTAVANREQTEVANLIGFFSNSIVLRSQVDPEESFASHLARIKAQDISDFDHQQLPFELLAEKLNPERSLSHNPIFQIVLNLNNNDVEGIELSDSDIEGNRQISYESNFDLTLYAVEQSNGIKLAWRYATDLFKPETIARMAASFETLLSAVLADPQCSLQSLPLVSDDELAALAQLSQGPEPTRDAVLLPELIRTQAATRGDATALVLGEESWSFAALSARANQMARALVAAGVRVGDRVGVCQERSLDMLASVVGVMQAGAVYVPLDPGYPDERLSYLLADAGIGHVLTQGSLAGKVCLSGQAVVLVSEADEQDAGEFASPVTATTTAYMIYTSGSTGQPKGVCIGHGAFADKLAALAQHYGLTSEDRGLLFASMSFDASLSQLFVPLSAGGSVALRPDDITEPEALLRYVAAQGVTWMHVVPAYLRQLVEVKGWERTALRRVTSGGDVLDRGLQQAWFTPERSSIALYNSYGPTEISITSSSHLVGADEAVVAIGRPLANTRYWVLDEQGQLLPRGAVGELCIGGSGLAQGYWQRDEQTQQRFVELTLAGRRERLYRTGDRVRWNEEGQLVFVGRNDHQVKVRGYRIELGEVESALQACAGVTGAVVKVEDDSLWAYVALASGDLAQVEAELASHLPAYLLPSGYEKVDEWPLTRSGKIDRKALRRGQDASRTRREPCNEVEQTLHEIWTALLKADDIGVTDNFFQRGGHSLLATRLASQIRRRFEVDFTLKSLFELPSIEEQARLICLLKMPARDVAAEGQDMEAMEEFDV